MGLHTIPSGNGWGVTWDGQYLWAVDDYFVFYQTDPADGQILQTVPSLGFGSPQGITWDGRYIWGVESNGLMIYQIDVGASSPTGSINGTVIDIAGTPLRTLVIAINADTKDKYKAFTDSSGYYEMPDVLPGTYWILCIKKDYKAGIRKIEVEAGKVTECPFVLKPKLE